MKREERIMTTPDERVATTDPERETDNRQGEHESAHRRANRKEDLRDRHDETIVNKEAALVSESAASSGTTVVRDEPAIARDRSRPSHPGQIRVALFEADETRRLRDQWTRIQGGFVDEPRRAVQEADALVAEVTKRLTDGFSNERKQLEGQWDRGDKASTEELRVALTRYHAFFDRLLSV